MNWYFSLFSTNIQFLPLFIEFFFAQKKNLKLFHWVEQANYYKVASFVVFNAFKKLTYSLTVYLFCLNIYENCKANKDEVIYLVSDANSSVIRRKCFWLINMCVFLQMTLWLWCIIAYMRLFLKCESVWQQSIQTYQHLYNARIHASYWKCFLSE